jgi:hypothetical protein
MWAARRYGTRPGRIEIDARSGQLVGSPSLSEADNEDVSDDELRRYLVQLRFRNRGGRDIPKAAFDGQPLTINLGLNVLTTGTAGRSEAERSDAASGPHPRRLQLAMGRKRGGERPHVVVGSPLVDVEVKVKIHKDWSASPLIIMLPDAFGFKGADIPGDRVYRI